MHRVGFILWFDYKISVFLKKPDETHINGPVLLLDELHDYMISIFRTAELQ